MAIFNGNLPACQTTTVTNSVTPIYSSTSFGGVSFPTGVTLRDLTVVNTGTVTCYVGGSAVSGSTTGVILAPGNQLTIQGWTAATAGGNVMFAITAAGSTTVECSLATLASVA